VILGTVKDLMMVFSTLSAQPHSSAASYFCSCRNWRDDGTANDPKPDLPQKTNMRQKKANLRR
ncbi:hypothetical protein AVEN_189966-1, partial [Araneus ventricosus]